MMKRVALFTSLVLTTSFVYAGGYRVALQGQKAQGMAHASVALSNNTESIFFNPAGLTFVGDSEVTMGINAVSAKNNYQNADLGISASTDSPVSTPLNIYWGKSLGEKSAIGVGLYTPYGSKVEWPTDWAGSHLVNYIDLQAIFIQPTYAIELNDKSSFGAGLILAVGSVEFNRNLTTSMVDVNGNRSNVTISDSGITEFGFNLGGLYSLNEKMDIGVNYRSKIIMKSKGDADFQNVPVALSTTFVDGGYAADLPLPAEFTVGMSYKHSDRLTFAVDYNYTFWGVYDALNIDFTNPATPDSNNPRNYKNSSTYRFGFEYEKSAKLLVRGGYYFDESPIRDGYFAPETPRGDQHGLTGGLTYKYSDNVEIDFSAILLDFEQVNNSYDFSEEGSFAGSYTTSTWIIGAGTSIQF